MSRTIKTVAEMTAELEADKNRSGYTKKLYKQQSDEHKGEQLQSDIGDKLAALKEADGSTKINWDDIGQVKDRTYSYLEACKNAGVYPSVMGLAVFGYGVSRQALNAYLNSHNNATTDFIAKTKDIMADILTNASLYNNANAVQVIFQLKNHFNYTDTVQLQPAVAREESTIDVDAIRKRYLIDDAGADELTPKKEYFLEE